ncbi:MAG TPA: AtpZ/AtpI family protein [Dehalococcoidia bacterium]|nr:AtpZ/AtpI family protein [Dehalococcoidia bacterium]
MDKRLAALGMLGVGFFVAGSIILGVVGGNWLDSKLNSEPLWLIVGLLLGIVVAFYGVYAMLRPFLKDKQDKGNS